MRHLPVVMSVCAMVGLASCAGHVDRDRYPVFFEPSSTTLSSMAQNIVDKAAADARDRHAKLVEVIGHAGARGDLSADEMLSVKRAKAVADALHMVGVGSAQITQIARPPANKKDATIASRLVTIEIDPDVP